MVDMKAIFFVVFLSLLGSLSVASTDKDVSKPTKLYSIEGSAEIMDGTDPKSWLPQAKILIDGGKYIGHFKSSGDFKIFNIPPGSYLVEVVHPNFLFEPARVDISSKSGKIRARKVNLLKPGSVSSLSYPLKFQTDQQAPFFEKREQWNIIDILKNPMVMFMVAPMLLMLVFSKVLNTADPGTKKEMQESMAMFQNPSNSMPSMEEMFTNFFGGSSGGSGNSKRKSVTANSSGGGGTNSNKKK